jgi:iron(III) transport system substrate-binding protein
MLWANQDGRGVHSNVSGIGVTAAAANPGNAIKLIEWLSGHAGQAADDSGLPGSNLEFPVNPEVAPHSILSDFGEWKADPMLLGEFGKYQADAVGLLQRAGHR